MKRIYDACRGQYGKMFEYQRYLEATQGALLFFCLDPEYDSSIFQRFYVSFDACKKGVQASCRQVIGVDRCFFKGGCNCELIFALGRDANKYIYPIVWAVMEKETRDSWSWFLGLLQKDVHIPIGGNGWLIIFDQQKVTPLSYIFFDRFTSLNYEEVTFLS